ncbi:MAG: hypothetical protein ACK46X_07525 [Candidatus Sericytochromatia bacterium]
MINKLTQTMASFIGPQGPLAAIGKVLEATTKLLDTLKGVGQKTSPQQFKQLDEKLTQARGTGRLAVDAANAFLADPVKGTKELTPKTAIQP